MGMMNFFKFSFLVIMSYFSINNMASAKNLLLEDISFEGQGCAISMASASIMTDLVKGKEEFEVKEIVSDFLNMIKERDELNNNILHEDDKTKLMCLSGVKQYPMRVKCATLSWHTLTSAINNSQEEINTERN